MKKFLRRLFTRTDAPEFLLVGAVVASVLLWVLVLICAALLDGYGMRAQRYLGVYGLETGAAVRLGLFVLLYAVAHRGLKRAGGSGAPWEGALAAVGVGWVFSALLGYGSDLGAVVFLLGLGAAFTALWTGWSRLIAAAVAGLFVLQVATAFRLPWEDPSVRGFLAVLTVGILVAGAAVYAAATVAVGKAGFGKY